uniref:ATG16 domain-containing protein n=1 Tax=Heterorhabditis bacteriophora TaxID=37862 RepID=A0A1I7XVU9_HETBA
MLEAGTSSTTTTTNSQYRDEILKRLEQRNNLIQPFVAIFNNYSSMAEELVKVKLMQNTRNITQNVDVSEVSSFEMQAMKEELASVYKLKSRNDQALIDANRKLTESEGRLAKVTEERDKLVADKTKLFTRLAELECSLKKVTEEKLSLYDEWLALNAMLKVKTEELTTMKNEQLRLINKVRELNEQRASYMNNEVSIQEELVLS